MSPSDCDQTAKTNQTFYLLRLYRRKQRQCLVSHSLGEEYSHWRPAWHSDSSTKVQIFAQHERTKGSGKKCKMRRKKAKDQSLPFSQAGDLVEHLFGVFSRPDYFLGTKHECERALHVLRTKGRIRESSSLKPQVYLPTAHTSYRCRFKRLQIRWDLTGGKQKEHRPWTCSRYRNICKISHTPRRNTFWRVSCSETKGQSQFTARCAWEYENSQDLCIRGWSLWSSSLLDFIPVFSYSVGHTLPIHSVAKLWTQMRPRNLPELKI